VKTSGRLYFFPASTARWLSVFPSGFALSIPDDEADRQGHLGKKNLLAGGRTVPRLPKPFRWRDGWYTDAGGKRTRLLDKSATFTAANEPCPPERRRLVRSLANVAFNSFGLKEINAFVGMV
jgi:hypothetical protein